MATHDRLEHRAAMLRAIRYAGNRASILADGSRVVQHVSRTGEPEIDMVGEQPGDTEGARREFGVTEPPTEEFEQRVWRHHEGAEGRGYCLVFVEPIRSAS